MPPSDPFIPGTGADQPLRSNPEAAQQPVTQTPGGTMNAEAYSQWQRDQAEAAALEQARRDDPGANDPAYQAYLADQAEAERVRQLALMDPDYARWKASQDAEAERVAALGPACPYCHAPLDNPFSTERLPHCWACGYGSKPEQEYPPAEVTAQ